MHWGYKIMVTFIVFVIFILSLVYIASKQTNEMQEDNYYDKELVYQNVIDGKNNLEELGTIAITDTTDALVLQVPVAAIQNLTEGKIQFLCPSDEKSDFMTVFSPDAEGKQRIAKASLKSVVYTVRISWKKDSKPYYFEQSYKVD